MGNWPTDNGIPRAMPKLTFLVFFDVTTPSSTHIIIWYYCPSTAVMVQNCLIQAADRCKCFCCSLPLHACLLQCHCYCSWACAEELGNSWRWQRQQCRSPADVTAWTDSRQQRALHTAMGCKCQTLATRSSYVCPAEAADALLVTSCCMLVAKIFSSSYWITFSNIMCRIIKLFLLEVFPFQTNMKVARCSSRGKKGQGSFFVGQQVPRELVTTPFRNFYSVLSKRRAIYCPLNSL